MPDYTVLVSLDGGNTWAKKAGEPVKAGTPKAAAEKVRKADPVLRGNEDAQYLPLASFEPLMKRKQLVERFDWKAASAVGPAQKELSDAS